MLVSLTSILIIILLGIVMHDFKNRLIPLYLLLAAIVISATRAIIGSTLVLAVQHTIINILATLVILGISFIALFILRQKVFNPFNTLVGTGDLLFFPVLCISFSPINYMVFIVVSGFVLISYKLLYRSGNTYLPLAGMQALLLTALLVISEFSVVNLNNDAYIMNLIF